MLISSSKEKYMITLDGNKTGGGVTELVLSGYYISVYVDKDLTLDYYIQIPKITQSFDAIY